MKEQTKKQIENLLAKGTTRKEIAEITGLSMSTIGRTITQIKKDAEKLKSVKSFVLDTNVLVHDPECIFKFEENTIYITNTTLEELDKLKKYSFSAREAARNLVNLREYGNLHEGVPVTEHGKLYLFTGSTSLSGDDAILETTMQIARERQVSPILVTNDILMILRADAKGIPVEEFKNDRISRKTKRYTGRSEHVISQKAFNKLMKEGAISTKELEDKEPLMPNEFLILRTPSGSSVLAKYKNMQIRKLEYLDDKPSGLTPRNAGQRFLQEALLDPDIHLLCVQGIAGSGKTLVALACGLEQVMKQKRYKNILVCRSNIKMDEDIGALPGTEQEKISPLLRGIMDNLLVLMEIENPSLDPGRLQYKVDRLFESGHVQAESMAYMRGRSIRNTFVIIDEAQNTNLRQILSITTRIGEGSKLVLLGDLDQIDNIHLDAYSSGLAISAERLKGSPLTAVVKFQETECVRSELAKLAAKLLK